MATIIADNRSSDLKLELALLGTTRGYFFKWLASEVHGPDEDDAFMLGLFSTLEAAAGFRTARANRLQPSGDSVRQISGSS